MYNCNKKSILSIPLFENLHEKHIDKLVSSSNLIQLKKGQILFSERDVINNIYIAVNGKVTLYRLTETGQKRIIYILDKGEIINEVIFDDLPASINCEAFEDSSVLALNKNDLLEVMEEDFQVTKKIMYSMGKKIRRLYRQLKNAVPIKIDKKLAAKLWKLSRDYGVEVDGGTLINLDISITYLADMLGNTREAVSRCINNFEKNGLIEFKGRKIIIKDRESLSIYFRGM
ncbi:Crp/Fnr family transcriptional regulator [Clostridium sp. MSJ-11]|uniref:Crp/Fnr family transcriptional regulator n=1 Tax=Clostridium mobile TaxID=2841512 RepID=A0ABS6EIZ0_9CLOT|nr:Crp/Fnr family transcriptional regulator [Clostridium mobile]MBU5485177.1 Crp/Fnr family transcriptional regulator [Clostridium mobile]